MTTPADLLSALQSAPAGGRSAALATWQEGGGDLNAAAWDAPDALLAAVDLLVGDGLSEDAGQAIAEATQDRARGTLRGSQDPVDFRMVAAFAQGSRACGRASEANEALAAVAGGEHGHLVEALLDGDYGAWAAHAPFHAPWAVVEARPAGSCPTPARP
jgi:hypothetical protein